ncbi:MAG TPA: right-handed parallel beta-helix repeat-containing protein [Azospirillum sp.]
MAKIHRAVCPQEVTTAACVCQAAKTVHTDASTAVLLLEAGPDGAEVHRVWAVPRSSVAATKLTLYWSPDAGATLYPVDSELMPAYTLINTDAIPETPFPNITKATPLPVPAGGRLYAAIAVAAGSGIAFHAVGTGFFGAVDHGPEPVEDVFYVAPDGRDTWSGLLPVPNARGTDGPFATLGRARDAMRATPTIATTLVRAGTHRLTATLELTAQDDGVTFRAHPGEAPVISGGERVTGFMAEGGGVFAAQVATPTDLDLVIGTVRQSCAQTGDRVAGSLTAGWLFADEPAGGASATALVHKPGQVPANVFQAGLRIQALDRDRRRDDIATVASIDTTTRTITLATAAGTALRDGSTFRLLNSPALIRDVGEFAWRATDSTLVVKPANPVTFEADGVVVPRVTPLVRLTGAAGVTLEGLTLAHVPWSGVALEVSGGRDHDVVGCSFRHVGTAIRLTGSTGNRIERNTLENLGASGIALSGGATGNIIQGNTILDIGEIAKTVCAIGGGGMNDTLIRHNLISRSPRAGIAIRNVDAATVNTGNTVAFNHITATMQETAEGGAIEMIGVSNADTGALVHGNHIDNCRGLASSSADTWIERAGGYGVYLDDRTNGVTVSDNVLRDCGGGHVFIRGGDDNVVTNNLGIMGSSGEDFIRIESNPAAGSAGTPANNSVHHNVIYAAAAVDDYWELVSANSASISANLVHNTPGYTGGSDTAADPLFVDPLAGDYRLAPASPAHSLGIHGLDWQRMGPDGLDL